ncbi:MAG TPA: hypothetical protein VIJ94_01175, partial [Caulobacteraceae bacterium]
MIADRDNQMFALPVAHYDRIAKLAPVFAAITDDIRRETLETFLPALQERYLQLLRSPKRNFDARIGAGDDILKALQQDGVALHALHEKARQEIRDYVTPIAHEIMARLDTLTRLRFSDGQVALDPVEHASLYVAVERALIDCGALPAFSAHAGRKLGLLRLVAQVNTQRETQLKYGDIDAEGLPRHKTSYFHVDSTDWPTVK